MSSQILHLSESQVKEVLNWPVIYDAVEQALAAITSTKATEDQSRAVQQPRNFTRADNGLLGTMPGFITNYRLSQVDNSETRKFTTLACKLVTVFNRNSDLNPPKPNILANILVFNSDTGELRAIVEGTEITAWRTAAASIVATDYLYFKKSPDATQQLEDQPKVLAIVGCGVQGRIHLIGFATLKSLSKIYLWNRTASRSQKLRAELNSLRSQFRNPNLEIQCVDSVEECVRNADIIVTATFTSTPLISRSMIKNVVHINAVGAGAYHHNELALNVYQDSRAYIYVDHWAGAKTELETLDAVIIGEVGDFINGTTTINHEGITIFHSLGMAIEDAAVAEAVLQLSQK